MRTFYPLLLSTLVLCLALPLAEARRKPLFGGPSTVAVGADGTIPGSVAAPQMGQGGYISGATKVTVPLIAVAFETSAEAKVTHASGGDITTKSLELHLAVDDAVLQAICAELQAIVEKDLIASGFGVLPKDTVDADARWTGITKNAPTGVDVKDNFMSGFMGNGSMNRWFTAGNRPLFGTGATGPLSELSPLIHLARERKISLLLYRFKVQFTDIESGNGLVFNYVKGKNLLRVVSADVSVFTPEHTLGTMIKLNANVTAGTDFVADLVGSTGNYKVVADPAHYQSDTLLLLSAISKQFSAALRKGQ